jgi:hypothetical protein
MAASLTKPMKLTKLVATSCGAAELFELVEEALDEVALFGETGVVGALELAISLRDDGFGSPFSVILSHRFNSVRFSQDC